MHCVHLQFCGIQLVINGMPLFKPEFLGIFFLLKENFSGIFLLFFLSFNLILIKTAH